MAGPKIASERRTCGQALLSTAWAGLGGQQPLALAQNRANTLGLLGKEKCFSSGPYQRKGHTVGTTLYLQKGSQSSECPTEINQPKVVKLDTTGSPPIGKEAVLFSLL